MNNFRVQNTPAEQLELVQSLRPRPKKSPFRTVENGAEEEEGDGEEEAETNQAIRTTKKTCFGDTN